MTSQLRTARPLSCTMAAALVVAVCLAVMAGLTPQSAWAAQNGLVHENGQYHYIVKDKPVTSTWKTIDGSRYYFDKNGNAVVGGAKKIDGTYYVFSNKGKLLKPSKSKIYTLKQGVFYVNKKGQPAATSWCIVGGKLYQASKSGKCTTGKKVDGIVLQSDGSAKMDVAAKLKMAVMKKLDKLTTPSMTKKQKLRKCFNYCLSRKWQASAEPKDIGTPGWMQRCAYHLLTTERGECFNCACSFAAFAFELGYKPVIRCVPKSHAYVIIDGKSYDNMGPRFGGALRDLGRTAKDYKFNTWAASKASSATATKGKTTGLKKEKGAYYYYKNGKMQKSKWIEVGSSRYYFRSNGKAAVAPTRIKGVWYVFAKNGKLQKGKAGVIKVDGASYRVKKDGSARKGWDGKKLYLDNGRMATGVVLYEDKLYAFSGKGVVNDSLSKKLRSAAKVDKDAKQLLALLNKVEKPQKIRSEESCYNLNGMTGKDVMYVYATCTLSFFKGSDGVTYYVGAEQN